ncbi:MAG: MFS transporter [Fibrobacteres bacterium]|nr:MFS transporter [Fibrobacterota bacterium]
MSNNVEEQKKAISKDRVRFGLGTILYQSEEGGFINGPVPTAIIRFLGGDDRHLGMISSFVTLGGASRILANSILKWKNSNRRAMVFTMYMGAVITGLIALLLITGLKPEIRPFVLTAYLVLNFLFVSMTGLQGVIDMNWVGDLVPLDIRGWFTKIKWVLSVIGGIFFTILISRYAQSFPTLIGYASIYVLFCVSLLIAGLIIYPKATDRTPQSANFVKSDVGGKERINYKIPALWLNFIFSLLWMPARTITGAFVPIYLMHQFNYSLTSIALLLSLQGVISIFVILFIGDRMDRWGAWKPMLAVTMLIACSMSLWFFSAWLGIGCAVVYMIVNGAAGSTLSMLGGNFQLEIYPEKGRAAYMGFFSILTIPFTFLATFSSGYLVHHLGEIHYSFMGAVLTRYHFVFLGTTILGLLSTVPLFLVGNPRKRRIER